jgi:hypothetical protein
LLFLVSQDQTSIATIRSRFTLPSPTCICPSSSALIAAMTSIREEIRRIERGELTAEKTR